MNRYQFLAICFALLTIIFILILPLTIAGDAQTLILLALVLGMLFNMYKGF